MALPTYKEIVDLVKKGATVEAQEKIMALREAALELQEENLDLKEEVKTLNQQLEIKAKIKFDEKVYWFDDEGKTDGPFCQRCYDMDKKLLRLQPATFRGGPTNAWTQGGECMECNSQYAGHHHVLFKKHQ